MINNNVRQALVKLALIKWAARVRPATVTYAHGFLTVNGVRIRVQARKLNGIRDLIAYLVKHGKL